MTAIFSIVQIVPRKTPLPSERSLIRPNSRSELCSHSETNDDHVLNEYIVLACSHDRPSYWEEHYGGRLGNQILCLFSAALEAHVRGMRFGIINCTHPVLDMTPFHVNASKAVRRYIHPETAFKLNLFIEGIYNFAFPRIAACVRHTVLVPLLATLDVGNKKYSPDALVIHIRSGDVFKRGHRSGYTPPPFSFYADIIDQHAGEVVVVTQNENMSPVVNKILDAYPHTKLQIGTLQEDIGVILAAKYLVLAQGTFSWGLALASRSLKVAYAFNNDILVWDRRTLGDIRVVEYEAIDGYLPLWNVSTESIDFILNFSREKLKHTEFKPEVNGD